MRFSRIAFLAGVGALAVAGVAHAASTDTHVMTVELPDGQIEHIRYTGDVAPTVTVEPVFAPAPAAMVADPFVMLRQISAEMDAEAAAMMREMAAMPFPGDAGPITVAAGPGVCVRSVQITYTGSGQPHVVSRTSGDCASAPRDTGPVALPPTREPTAPAVKTYQARYAPAPYRAPLRLASNLAH